MWRTWIEQPPLAASPDGILRLVVGLAAAGLLLDVQLLPHLSSLFLDYQSYTRSNFSAAKY
jgi:hypothetical protein